jgi:hypothetical protein
LSIELVATAFFSGLVATGVMTLTELPSWKKWGLRGVFEWHENQILISRLLKLDPNRLNYPGIFGLHFLNGGLGGAGLALALLIIPFLDLIPFYLLGTLYGIFLWVLTLVPIHKPITGLDPFRHPLGIYPSIASLAGHAAYGLVLGALILL